MFQRLAILTLIAVAHLALHQPSEPFFNSDESRHLMTGVFFRDAIVDWPVWNARDYAIAYYLQYPALCLLIYPPFFHAVLGGGMLVFGTSLLVGKVTILLFSLIACHYLHGMASRTHGPACAAIATLIFGLSPLVFELSQHVMLEVPTLACSLAAVHYFLSYLDLQRRRDIYFSSLALSLAVLTRPDGFFLIPALLLLCYSRGRMDQLLRKDCLQAMLLALVLIFPVYALIARHTNDLYHQAVMHGTYPGASRPFHPRNFLLYLVWLPQQMTWFALVPAGVGLWASLRSRELRNAWPYLAMVVACYAMIVSIAEVVPRHAVYWSPAIAVFAAHGIAEISRYLGTSALLTPLASLVIAGTFWGTFLTPRQFIRGYEAAAQYVVANSTQSRFCLFDNYLNGDFIYQVRRHDPARRLWVLRGDKLFYSTLSDSRVNYKEYVRGRDGILDEITRYDPELIVVEEPQAYSGTPMAELLRTLLRDHPERFRLVASIPIRSNIRRFQGIKLLIYRNQVRNPDPAQDLEIDIQSLGRSIRTTIDPSVLPRMPSRPPGAGTARSSAHR